MFLFVTHFLAKLCLFFAFFAVNILRLCGFARGNILAKSESTQRLYVVGIRDKKIIRKSHRTSSFLSLYNKEVNKDNKRLNNKAHQKPATEKPLTSFSASKMIRAFITKRKSPKVTSVIGNVNNIRMGFTIALSTANTIATIIAVQNESNLMPSSR
jgi:hypothetical protein